MSPEQTTSKEELIKAPDANSADYHNGKTRSLDPTDSEQDAQESSQPEASTSKDNKLTTTLKRYWWLVPVLGVVLAVGGVTITRLQGQSENPETQTQPNPLSVRTVTAERESIRNWISSEGTVRAVDYKHLAFEVEGDVTYLARRNGRRLREGDLVKKGELLARVDDRELLADIRQAQAAVAEARQNKAAAAADVAQAQAQVSQNRAQVRQAQAQVEKAQTTRNLAQTNLERYRFLVNEGAVSQSEFDTRVNTLSDAGADVQAAQAEVAAAQGQVNAAQAQVRAAQEQLKATQSSITTAEARLEQAQVALEGARLYAPFDGIVAYLNITEGEYYSPQIVSSQLGGDYQGILDRIPIVIIDPSQYEAIVDLAGPTGEQVRSGQKAYVASETDIDTTARGGSDSDTLIDSARAEGEVFAVNPAISPGGRAIEARIRLQSGTTDLKHGERVTTWIAVNEAQNAVVVPINAVVYRDQIPYVFVVNEAEGVVEQRQVELGIEGITEQQIERGVEAEERVVTQGQNRLVDGASVQIVNDIMN